MVWQKECNQNISNKTSFVFATANTNRCTHRAFAFKCIYCCLEFRRIAKNGKNIGVFGRTCLEKVVHHLLCLCYPFPQPQEVFTFEVAKGFQFSVEDFISLLEK